MLAEATSNTNRLKMHRASSLLIGLTATVDFETKSRADLKKVGAARYARDPSTDFLCMAYRLPGDVTKIWIPGEPIPLELMEWVALGNVVESHNAEFEREVWNQVGVKKYGFPELDIEQLYCTAAQAAALALPRGLGRLGEALGVSILKDEAGRKTMLKCSKPRRPKKPTKKNPFPEQKEWFDDPADLEAVYKYCTNDVDAEIEASHKMPPLTPEELELYHATVEMNAHGILCDVRLCEIGDRFVQRALKELNGELAELTFDSITSANQVEKIGDFLRVFGVDLPDMAAGTVENALQTEMHPTAKRVLEIRQLAGLSSIKKFRSMINMACPEDNRLRGAILHHGASTGRDTGKGVQVQNLTKAPPGVDVSEIIECLSRDDYEEFKAAYPNTLETLSWCMRGMLIAPDDSTLYSGDFSGIEFVTVLWLAGDEAHLNERRNGIDSYVNMASVIYGRKCTKEDKLERELGKRAVLGCGFQMAGETFWKTCAKEQFPIPRKLADRAVKSYREEYYLVVKFWADLTDAVVMAIKNPGRVVTLRKLKFKVENGYLWIRLPSGRKIAYKDPEVTFETTAWGKVRPVISYMANATGGKWKREKTYGGKICENVTQATAADFMREASMRLKRALFRLLFRVHDEIVVEDKSKDRLEEFVRLMSIVPNWGAGVPLKVEAWAGPRYKK